MSFVASSVPLVLKGALYRFLASLAINEHGAMKIWSTLISFSVVKKTSSGKLVGMQVSSFFKSIIYDLSTLFFDVKHIATYLVAVSSFRSFRIHLQHANSFRFRCSKLLEGSFFFLKDELETQECVMKCYDSSLGFLRLMKALFLHTANVDNTHLLCYLQFIIKSIICQFANRSYENVRQMVCFLFIFVISSRNVFFCCCCCC